ncbi:MAG: macro domain-containing protein [Lachnospiraceae bacterium]|nr:macro domain-containing protein [Lachnospiraceae bacterium]
MIEFVTGNIFDSGADCLINTVNCEGFMGKGIAYQFKMRFPQNNLDYVKACKSGKLRIGTIHYFREEGVWVVNFPTKNKWREKSKIDYIEKGLDQLAKFIAEYKPQIIAIPPLGCGNGGLDWNVVKSIIVEKLQSIGNEHTFLVYEPSISYKAIPKQAPDISVSGLALLQIRLHLKKFNALRLQKAGYFTNYYLEEDYFKFDKWKYGPYSHGIDIVARSLNEYQKYYGLTNSEDTYEQIYKVICSKKTEEKLEILLPAIEKSTAYINQISTDKKLEGVATVLFIIQKNNQIPKEMIVQLFREWSEDKAKRFPKSYIIECIDYLEKTDIIVKNICENYEILANMWK